MGLLSKIFGPPQHKLGINEILDNQSHSFDDKCKYIHTILNELSHHKRVDSTNWLNQEFEVRKWDQKKRIKFAIYGYVYQAELEANAVKQSDGKWTINVNFESKGKFSGKNIYLEEGVSAQGEEMISIKIYD